MCDRNLFTLLCHLHLTHWPCVESLSCPLWPQLQYHTSRSLYTPLRCHQGQTAKPTYGKTDVLQDKQEDYFTEISVSSLHNKKMKIFIHSLPGWE